MRISDWSSDVCSSDLEANCVIGEAVTVGDGTVIGPNASLAYCQVGRACQIHDGARIGPPGFGFSMDPEGFVDVPQLSRVIVGDGVEFGAKDRKSVVSGKRGSVRKDTGWRWNHIKKKHKQKPT